MSKASISSRPEPGYENMDHFSINVDYVAEMLRTIEFQTGACTGEIAAVLRGHWGCLGCPALSKQSSPHHIPCVEIPHRIGDVIPTLSTSQGPCRVTPAPGCHTGLVTSLLGTSCSVLLGHLPPGMSWCIPVMGREGRSQLSCPLPTEPLGEDEADGPGEGSEAATDEDRLDSLEVPEAAEGECMPWLPSAQGCAMPRAMSRAMSSATPAWLCHGPCTQHGAGSILFPLPLQMWARGRSQRALPMVRP